MGSRDGGQSFIEHTGKGEQIVALILQRDAYRADTSRILGLAARQFLDDKVEQRLARGQGRPGQCQNVMAQPLRERADVAGKAGRPHLGLPRKLQFGGKLRLAVWVTLSRAADPVLKLLAA